MAQNDSTGDPSINIYSEEINIPETIFSDSIEEKVNQEAEKYLLNTGAEFNCNIFIRDAGVLYNIGEYRHCISLLEKGLNECSLGREEEENALTELIKAYIETDDLEKTELYTKRLLINNPNYVIKRNFLQPDFLRVYNSYNINPLFSIGIIGGINLPKYKIINTYSLLDSVNYQAPYKAKLGDQYGVRMEFCPLKNISFGADLLYATTKYYRKMAGTREWLLNYRERISSHDASAFARIYLSNKKLIPFITVGAYISRTYTAVADASISYQTNDNLTATYDKYFIYQNDIDILNKRNIFNKGMFGGIGARYKIENLIVGIESNYLFGFTNFVDINRRYANKSLLYNFYYIDNDFKVDKINLMLSAAYILKYSVKKKRNG